MRFKLDIFNDGHVRWHGVDTGVTIVMAHNPKRKIIALKIAGHSSPSGQERLYSPAHFAIYEYELVENYPDSVAICIEIDELFGVLHWNVRGKK